MPDIQEEMERIDKQREVLYAAMLALKKKDAEARNNHEKGWEQRWDV